MATILFNKIYPGGSSVKNIAVGSSEVKFAKLGSTLLYDTQSSIVYDKPTISFSYSTSAVAASGGTLSPTLSYSQKWRRVGYSGTNYEQTANTSNATISYKVTAGSATVNSSGVVTWASNTSTSARNATIQVTVTLNGQSNTASFTVNQAAGYYTYSDISISTFTYSKAAGTAGSTSTPTLSYSQTYGWNGTTSGVGTITGKAGDGYTTFTVSGTGASINNSTGVVTWTVNPGTTERSASVNVTVSRNGKSKTSTTTVYQQLGDYITEYGTPVFSVTNNTLSASGGTATITASVTNTWSISGKKAGTVTITETADNNNRYSYSGTTLTHSNMTTNATTDNVTLTAYNADSTSKTATQSFSIVNAIVNNRYNKTFTSYGPLTASQSGDWGSKGQGGTVTITASATNYFNYQELYTSGSTSEVKSGSEPATISIDAFNSVSYVTKSGNTITFANMGTNAGSYTYRVCVKNYENFSVNSEGNNSHQDFSWTVSNSMIVDTITAVNSLSVDPTTINAPASGDTYRATVTSNITADVSYTSGATASGKTVSNYWNFTLQGGNTDIITVANMGNGTFTIKVPENTTETSRDLGQVAVMYAGFPNTATVTITQAAKASTAVYVFTCDNDEIQSGAAYADTGLNATFTSTKDGATQPWSLYLEECTNMYISGASYTAGETVDYSGGTTEVQWQLADLAQGGVFRGTATQSESGDTIDIRFSLVVTDQ